MIYSVSYLENLSRLEILSFPVADITNMLYYVQIPLREKLHCVPGPPLLDWTGDPHGIIFLAYSSAITTELKGNSRV